MIRALFVVLYIGLCVGAGIIISVGIRERNKALATPCVEAGGHYQPSGLGYPATCWAPDGVTRLFPKGN